MTVTYGKSLGEIYSRFLITHWSIWRTKMS